MEWKTSQQNSRCTTFAHPIGRLNQGCETQQKEGVGGGTEKLGAPSLDCSNLRAAIFFRLGMCANRHRKSTQQISDMFSMTNFDARTITQNAFFVAATRLFDVCPLYVARLFMCRLILLIVCFDGNGGLMERLYRNLLQAQDSEFNLFFMLPVFHVMFIDLERNSKLQLVHANKRTQLKRRVPADLQSAA